ncbi:hypothetical protein EYE40_03940 [Glaciihabitans arcticus]|uniref:DUF4352 domain-containing protein n=1 Tax=Glaciihabitans arcticus TaxID=2668039 RepID=A0A4Q9GRC8_9MICO|nr:hypothetical protein [Glaciihabitans arcticus]TBN56614.1 hypothetical protein EYE40_03940 [Glaciihabitans arcticus]
MTDSPIDPPVASRRRRVPWWVWTLIAIAAVVGLVAAIGGFRDVPITALPRVELGEAHIGSEVRTVVSRAYLSDTQPTTGREADAGSVYLVVEASAENVGTTPSLLDSDLIRVFAGDEISPVDEPSNVIELRSGDVSEFLQPGVAVDLAWIWPVDAGSLDVGDDVFVGIFDQFAVYDHPIWGDDSFGRPTPVARVITSVASYEQLEGAAP